MAQGADICVNLWELLWCWLLVVIGYWLLVVVVVVFHDWPLFFARVKWLSTLKYGMV